MEVQKIDVEIHRNCRIHNKLNIPAARHVLAE